MLLKTKTVNRVLLLPVDAIWPNPDQPRRVFDGDKISELAASIKQYGLLQPITVQQIDRYTYQLIAGERRLLACKELGMGEIPAIVCDMNKESSAALALIENIQRCSLNYFEEALAIDHLMSMLGLTQQSVAARLGKTQSTIANKLRLLKYPPSWQERMLTAGLTERHARALLPLLGTEKLDAAIDSIAEKELTVAQTEQLVQKLLQQEQPKAPMELMVVKDLSVFLDTVQQATEMMKLAGIKASTRVKENEEELVYTIRIKKKNFI